MFSTILVARIEQFLIARITRIKQFFIARITRIEQFLIARNTRIKIYRHNDIMTNSYSLLKNKVMSLYHYVFRIRVQEIIFSDNC